MAARASPTQPQAPAPRADFTPAEAEEIARIAETAGWPVAAHDRMRTLEHHAYRLATDECGAQLRFLLPLTAEDRVLQLRCGWGPVSFALATQGGPVIAMDERPAPLRFVAARRRQSVSGPVPVCGDLAAGLPFADNAFDAVVMLDALESVGATSWLGWQQRQRAALAEVRRVLRPGGFLLLGVANRLSFARPGADRPRRLRTYWGYHAALRQAGFVDVEFHAPLPSHREPFFILPLERPRLLSRFVDGLFIAQDYRTKLEERGLGSIFHLAHLLWRAGRWLRLDAAARFVVPSYLIVARS